MGVGEEDDQKSKQRQQSRHLKVKCFKVLNMHRILSLSLSFLTNSISNLDI